MYEAVIGAAPETPVRATTLPSTVMVAMTDIDALNFDLRICSSPRYEGESVAGPSNESARSPPRVIFGSSRPKLYFVSKYSHPLFLQAVGRHC
ncbi:unannotated protein [freshwater metagenome]|uniref:Unannotated protein n=1 Tax=freshwater metagenome TaxID=449393 RepID=A0A6J7P6H8_9ZZZZ